MVTSRPNCLRSALSVSVGLDRRLLPAQSVGCPSTSTASASGAKSVGFMQTTAGVMPTITLSSVRVLVGSFGFGAGDQVIVPTSVW